MSSSFIKEVFKITEKLINQIERTSLDRSWLHGDPAEENCVFKKYLLFCDLDNFRYGFKIWDIAKLMSLEGGIDHSAFGQRFLLEKWKTNRIEILRERFCLYVPFSEIEFQTLPQLICLHLVLSFISEFALDDDAYGSKFTKNISFEADNLLILLRL